MNILFGLFENIIFLSNHYTTVRYSKLFYKVVMVFIFEIRIETYRWITVDTFNLYIQIHHASFFIIDVVIFVYNYFSCSYKSISTGLGLNNLFIRFYLFLYMMLFYIFSNEMMPITQKFHLHSFTTPNTSCITLLIPILSRLGKFLKKWRSTPDDSYVMYA